MITLPLHSVLWISFELLAKTVIKTFFNDLSDDNSVRSSLILWNGKIWEPPPDLGKDFLSGHESHPLSQLTQDFWVSFVRGFYIQDSAPLKMEIWERVAVKGVRESGTSGVWITDLLQETVHTEVADLEIGFSLSLWGVDRPLLQARLHEGTELCFLLFLSSTQGI